MRYSLKHKARNREKILAMAARSVREHGGDSSGIGTVMKKVGLTKGGFYRHFASKDDLFVLPVERPIVTASALITAVEEFRGSIPCRDDQSVIVLQKTDGCLS